MHRWHIVYCDPLAFAVELLLFASKRQQNSDRAARCARVPHTFVRLANNSICIGLSYDYVQVQASLMVSFCSRWKGSYKG